MSDVLEQGAETQEVAAPVETQEESVETQEVAEPAGNEETEDTTEEESGKTDQDTAFAEMRRNLEEAERRAAEAEEQLEQKEALRNLLSDAYGGSEDPEIEALAEKYGVEPEELQAEIESEAELERVRAENERMNQELEDIKVQSQMNADLKEIQKIDPSVKSLEDLGDDFSSFVAGGLSGVDAYFAAKAKEAKTKATPPGEIGKINQAKGPKDFYTQAEVDAMSPSEVNKNLDKIHDSMKKW